MTWHRVDNPEQPGTTAYARDHFVIVPSFGSVRLGGPLPVPVWWHLHHKDDISGDEIFSGRYLREVKSEADKVLRQDVAGGAS